MLVGVINDANPQIFSPLTASCRLATTFLLWLVNLYRHAALSGDYNDRTRLKAVKIECFVKRIQCQCFFILSVPPTPSLATGYTDNPLSTPVSHIKPDEQNLKECYPVNNRIFREGVHHFTSCGGSGSGIQWVTSLRYRSSPSPSSQVGLPSLNQSPYTPT